MQYKVSVFNVSNDKHDFPSRISVTTPMPLQVDGQGDNQNNKGTHATNGQFQMSLQLDGQVDSEQCKIKNECELNKSIGRDTATVPPKVRVFSWTSDPDECDNKFDVTSRNIS